MTYRLQFVLALAVLAAISTPTMKAAADEPKTKPPASKSAAAAKPKPAPPAPSATAAAAGETKVCLPVPLRDAAGQSQAAPLVNTLEDILRAADPRISIVERAAEAATTITWKDVTHEQPARR